MGNLKRRKCSAYLEMVEKQIFENVKTTFIKF